jgi:hypothetical protein
MASKSCLKVMEGIKNQIKGINTSSITLTLMAIQGRMLIRKRKNNLYHHGGVNLRFNNQIHHLASMMILTMRIWTLKTLSRGSTLLMTLEMRNSLTKFRVRDKNVKSNQRMANRMTRTLHLKTSMMKPRITLTLKRAILMMNRQDRTTEDLYPLNSLRSTSRRSKMT